MSNNDDGNNNNNERGMLSCSFCHASELQVDRLVAAETTLPDGSNVTICNECNEDASAIFRQQAEISRNDNTNKAPIPEDIEKFLSDYVIGQDEAKKVLAVAVYNHYQLLAHNETNSDIELSKSNILMVGPTGSGKTLVAETLAGILDVPFTIADATTLTQAGYVGEDVENIIGNLLEAAEGDVERAQRGIVYIDEIDKITRKSSSSTLSRDVSGEGVQQSLLKIIEGRDVSVSPQGGNKRPGTEETKKINTSNILFICGGAFAGLDKIIARRGNDKSLGFGAEIKEKDKRNTGEILANIEPQDLLEYGLIPEFVGRVQVITTLRDLDVTALTKILTEPKNALIKQYQKRFSLENTKLSFTDDALEAIAKKAMARETGARGLRSILENILLDTMFKLPGIKKVNNNLKEVVINAEVVAGNAKPLYVYEDKPQKEPANKNVAAKKIMP